MIETKRACGFRIVGKMYLVGEYIGVLCDRLPYPIGKCPHCGQGLKFPRTPSLIHPDIIFGKHEGCKDEHPKCFLCDPPTEGYLLGVGSEYATPRDFMVEAGLQGISKRIHQIPRKLVLGKTVVYLCHNKACDIPDDSPDEKVIPTGMINVPKTKKGLGIFTAFIPQRLEKLFYKSEITDKLKEKMAKRGITIVEIPDGDVDHAPAKLRKKLLKQRELKQLKQPPPLPARDSKGHFKRSVNAQNRQA